MTRMRTGFVMVENLLRGHPPGEHPWPTVCGGRIRESLAERRHIAGLHRTNRASSLERSVITEDRRPERPLR